MSFLHSVRRIILFVLFTLLLCPCSIVKAENADMRSWFDTWHTNRIAYNTYRDSIFEPNDRSEWVNICIRRAACHRRIFAENQAAIDAMHQHFRQPDVPSADYDTLFHLGMTDGKGLDVFMAIDIMDILLPHYKQQIQLSDKACFKYLVSLYCQSSFLYQVSNIGDTISARLLFPYLNEAVEFGFNPVVARYKDLQARTLLTWSMYSLICTDFVNRNIISVEDCDRNIQRIRQALESPEWQWFNAFTQGGDTLSYRHDLEVDDEEESPYFTEEERAYYAYYLRFLETYEANRWRKIYLKQWLKQPDEQHRQLIVQKAEGLDIERMMRKDYSELELALWALGRQSADEALAHIEAHHPLDTIPDIASIKGGGWTQHLSPLNNLINLLPHTTLSDEQRKARIKEYYAHFIDLLRMLKGDNDIRDINAIENFATNPVAISYLSTAERLQVLNDLMMSAQINTYAHSAHEASLAKTMVSGLIRYAPELLVGIPGCSTTTDVRLNRDSLEEYIWQAAMFHDLGKNSMAPIITNDFRRISDLEYRIIKLHPEKGLDFLDIDPTFSIYRDITLCHHKWHNGQGGYPIAAANTESPIHIMIDIITICDCLEAATDAVGRNYNPTKVFEAVLQEFESQSGTRYNGDIVRVIRQNPRFFDDLERLVSPWGCYANYYDIYKDFFRQH